MGRRLWQGGRAWPRREQYTLTDFRLTCTVAGRTADLLLQDISEVQRKESLLDRLLGTSTIVVLPRSNRRAPIVLGRVRRGAQLAALLELLAGDPRATLNADAVGAALSWEPDIGPGIYHAGFTSLASAIVVLAAVAVSLHGRAATIAYPSDDAIYPSGEKRSRADIVRFMESAVMPWALRRSDRSRAAPTA